MLLKWFSPSRLGLYSLCLSALLGSAGCVSLFLEKSPSSVTGAAARPPALAEFQGDPAISASQDWTDRRAPLLREEFQNLVYGRMPAPFAPVVSARVVLDLAETRAFATAEQLTIDVSNAGPDGAPPLRFNMLLFTPKDASGPLPVLVVQNFCGNRALFSRRPEEIAATLAPLMSVCTDGKMDFLAHSVMGKYINGPPIKDVLKHGFALAVFHAGDVVPDDEKLAPAALERLSGGARPRAAALMAWAWTFSRAVDVLVQDSRIDPKRIVIWGHSRNGKDALIAGAFDPRIAGVIAHQSGRGGAALTRSTNGETVAKITKGYPHWFAPGFADYAGKEDALPVDQHQLIALIAPRPVLLGNARADNWSDPEGAFRALQGADPVYRLMGSSGLKQPDMLHPDMSGDLAFFIRPGNHGMTSRDWAFFLDWLDAHFGAAPKASGG